MGGWALKLGGGLFILAAFALVVWFYGKAQYRSGSADSDRLWSEKVIAAERSKLAAYQQGVASVQRSDARYIETIREKIVPITRTIVERGTAYAATPEGASICLAPDRVLWLDQTRSALFPPPAPGPTGGVAATLHPDAPGP